MVTMQPPRGLLHATATPPACVAAVRRCLDWFAVPFPVVPPELVRAQENAAVDLVPIHPVADELANRFAAAGPR